MKDMNRLRARVLWIIAVISGLSLVVSAQDRPAPPLSGPPWKPQIQLPGDPFVVYGLAGNEPGWVKFTILREPDGALRVYFQDGRQYPFHYHFATEHLAVFAGMTPEEFDRATLYREGRKGVLGAVITPPQIGSQPNEYGIQLVGRDPYTKEEVAELFDAVRQAVLTTEEFLAFYFPTYEQRAAAEADRAWLETRGIVISSAGRWAEGNTCYSEGWALGPLKYVEGAAIGEAYLNGTLEPNDILLTDGVPAEIPFVAGIITLSPSTPNSHVAILAKTYGVPFAHLALVEDANRAQELVGHTICLRAFENYGRTDVRLIDLEGTLDDATIQEILALKKPPQLDLAPVTAYGSYATSTDALMPSDIRYFGGKAANFGILRRAIPEHSPVAMAFSFDLWNDFLSQELADGRTLRETITAHLSGFRYPPSDMAAVSWRLSEIRNMFTDEAVTDFTDAQRQAIVSALQEPLYGFDPLQKLRFRSSTNMEDAEEFTGAGLYDSYSGCLADDLDGDNRGPCLCDPGRSKERGVYTVIRKVFASFYNENAWLERLRHDVDESDVGMAMLAHHSFPDEIEMANGVAAVKRRSGSNWEITLVTQAGATSVTNPTDGSIPEEVVVHRYSFDTYARQVRQSNLVPLGATVMEWQKDYTYLAELLVKVGDEFAGVTGEENFVLEMEYKKVAPEGKLVVKQVREIPQPDDTPSITPFLVNEPVEYCVFQGEYGDIFANHRLKSRWQFETVNLWLTEESLSSTLYGQVTLDYAANAAIGRLTGHMSEWPSASHGYTASGTMDAWRIADSRNPRNCRLHTDNIPTLVSPAESAILTLQDFGNLTFDVEYDEPVLRWDWPAPTPTTKEQVQLSPCPEPSAKDLLQKRRFEGPKGVSVATTFYWPPAPTGPTAGYTAPLSRWVETRIEGYTREPIVLRGYYSQTYKPDHHNFNEHFLFEPQLEPGLSPEVLAELGEKNIRLIHVHGGMSGPTITTYGFDDKL